MIQTWAVLAGALAIGAAGSWYVRGLQADADMAAFKDGLASQSQDQRDLKAKVEAAQVATTQKSTERLDEHQAERQKDIVYVEQKVIEYRDRWRDRACTRPAEWVQLYNESLFGPADRAVPETR